MEELDVNFLPIVYEILKSCSVEKDPYELPQKVAELKAKLQLAKEQIAKLPGIDYSKEEQERQLELLRQQLVIKTELLKKYKLCNLESTTK